MADLRVAHHWMAGHMRRARTRPMCHGEPGSAGGGGGGGGDQTPISANRPARGNEPEGGQPTVTRGPQSESTPGESESAIAGGPPVPVPEGRGQGRSQAEDGPENFELGRAV